MSGDYGLGVMSVTSKVTDCHELKDKGKCKDKDTNPNDKMCVYFNLGMCVGFGIVYMFKFIDAKAAK